MESNHGHLRKMFVCRGKKKEKVKCAVEKNDGFSESEGFLVVKFSFPKQMLIRANFSWDNTTFKQKRSSPPKENSAPPVYGLPTLQ